MSTEVKMLPDALAKEIEHMNKVRRLMGLSVIEIKIRECLNCQQKFQSAGRRTCGCNTDSLAKLMEPET